MNLVEKREVFKSELEKLISKRNELIEEIKQVEISIERYNGAIIAMNQLIKDEEDSKVEIVEEVKK